MEGGSRQWGTTLLAPDVAAALRNLYLALGCCRAVTWCVGAVDGVILLVPTEATA